MHFIMEDFFVFQVGNQKIIWFFFRRLLLVALVAIHNFDYDWNIIEGEQELNSIKLMMSLEWKWLNDTLAGWWGEKDKK